VARTLTRVALGLAASFALAAFIRDDRFSLLIRASVLGLALFAWRRPSAALLVVAAIAPFIDIILVTLGSPPVRSVELIVVAFLAGWLFSAPSRRVEATRAFAVPAALLAALVLASIAQVALELYRAQPDALWSALRSLRDSYFTTGEPIGFIAGVSMVEGMALMIATADLIDREASLEGRVLRALAIAGAVAGIAALLLAVGIGLPISLARHASLGARRFAAHIGDVNAAGSFYLIAGGAACASAFGDSKSKLLWRAVVAATAAGLVLSASRSAMAAALVAVAVVAVSQRGTATAVVIVAASAALAVAAGVPLVAHFGEGFQMRRDFSVASWRMIAARPWLGVGVGRYYELSRLVFRPSLATVYGYENAHNYFLQILAELGAAGLAAFVWLLAAALAPAVQHLRRDRASNRDMFLLAGVCAFLLTCISGHPLLLAEVAVPFWIALGVLAARAPRAADDARSSRSLRSGRVVVAACVLAIVATIPLRPGAPRLRLPPGADGFGPPQTSDGRRFRTVASSAALFFTRTVTFVEIPLRLNRARAGRPVTVLLRQPRWADHRVDVAGGWMTVPVTLPLADPLAPYQRIDLQVIDYADPLGDPHGQSVDVGEVTILGSRN
jgi:O-Antigen ligase